MYIIPVEVTYTRLTSVIFVQISSYPNFLMSKSLTDDIDVRWIRSMSKSLTDDIDVRWRRSMSKSLTDDIDVRWIRSIVSIVITLQITGLTLPSWYVLRVDLDSCYVCGPLIVAMGNTLEKKLEAIAKEDIDDDSDLIYCTQTEKNQFKTEYEFTIEKKIFIFIGIWKVHFCMENITECVGLELQETVALLSNVQPFQSITDNIKRCRPFIISAILINVVMLLLGSTISGSCPAVMNMYGGTFSASLSLISVVIAGLPYVTSVIVSNYLTPHIPWALICVAASGYLMLLTSLCI